MLLRFSAILEPTFTDAPLNIEALKCIANSLYLVATAKDVFWNQGGVTGCAVVLKVRDFGKSFIYRTYLNSHISSLPSRIVRTMAYHMRRIFYSGGFSFLCRSTDL